MLASDYARTIAYLNRDRFPPYVSFVRGATWQGNSDGQIAPEHIVVRVSDGAIVAGRVPPESAHVIRPGNTETGDNPFGKPGFFDPRCYVPTDEEQTTWHGEPALRFKLQHSCGSDAGITDLYADEKTLRPLAVDGDIDVSGVNTAIELRYTVEHEYVVPSSMNVSIAGHGWLFWMHETAIVTYSNYEFIGGPLPSRTPH